MRTRSTIRLPLVIFFLPLVAFAQSSGDLDENGVVDGQDLLLFLGQWHILLPDPIPTSTPVPATGPQTGWIAELGGGSSTYGVSGRAVVASATSIRLENFNYLNNGPDVFVYLIIASGTGDFTQEEGEAGFSVFSFDTNPSQPYENATLDIVFPAGVTIAPYTHVSIWCRQFRVDFGSGRLTPPASKKSKAALLGGLN